MNPNPFLRNMYFTYVLLSRKDGNRYVGYTKDLESRLEQHHNGRVESTKNRKPLELIYYEACLDQADALKREKYLKTHYGRLFLGNRLKNWKSENE